VFYRFSIHNTLRRKIYFFSIDFSLFLCFYFSFLDLFSPLFLFLSFFLVAKRERKTFMMEYMLYLSHNILSLRYHTDAHFLHYGFNIFFLFLFSHKCVYYLSIFIFGIYFPFLNLFFSRQGFFSLFCLTSLYLYDLYFMYFCLSLTLFHMHTIFTFIIKNISRGFALSLLAFTFSFAAAAFCESLLLLL
jgi:hypothetical protein